MLLKNLRDKCATVMKNYLEIYGAYWHKTTNFCLSTSDPVYFDEGLALKTF